MLHHLLYVKIFHKVQSWFLKTQQAHGLETFPHIKNHWWTNKTKGISMGSRYKSKHGFLHWQVFVKKATYGQSRNTRYFSSESVLLYQCSGVCMIILRWFISYAKDSFDNHLENFKVVLVKLITSDIKINAETVFFAKKYNWVPGVFTYRWKNVKSSWLRKLLLRHRKEVQWRALLEMMFQHQIFSSKIFWWLGWV